MSTQPQRDDRVLPATRWTAGIVGLVLVTAGVILYLFPTRTAELWAWEMGPPMTALAVGGGYFAGAVFFARAVMQPRWHPIGVTFLAATVLTSLLLVATLLHWESFSHGHVAFWTWTVVYVAAPGLLPLLWLRNRRRDPGEEVATPVVPGGIRRLVGAAGLVQTTAAVAFFVRPALMTTWWPWTLSPLTARTLSAFLAFVGMVWLAFLWEPRWSALRLHVQSVAVGLVLVGLGALRASDDLTGDPVVTAFVAGLLVASVATALALEQAMRRAPTAPGPVGTVPPGP